MTVGEKVRSEILKILGKMPRHRAQVDLDARFFGTAYGGWWLYSDELSKDSKIYSFGVGNDVSFDLQLIKQHQLQVYAFDPTPRSVEWVCSQTFPSNFSFYPYGIANYDGTARFFAPENPDHMSFTTFGSVAMSRNFVEAPVYKISTIINMLGHTDVDVLKLDVEGSEYGVLEEICQQGYLDIKQILVEFHFGENYEPIDRVYDTVNLLNQAGYYLYKISSRGVEYSFIKHNSCPKL